MEIIGKTSFQSFERETAQGEAGGQESVAPAPHDVVAIGHNSEKEWTVLFYMDGKAGFKQMTKASFKPLRSLGSDENVNLVAQLALGKEDARRGLIESEKSKEIFPGSQNVGKVDMGDPQTLKNFIEWGLKNYPAKHYAIVLCDHGAGYGGAITDEETKHLIDNRELAGVLRDVGHDMGKKIDLINFSGLLMGQAEVAYELKEGAHYMVSSEDAPKGSKKYLSRMMGDPHQVKVMRDLQEGIKEKGAIAPEELARLYVFESEYQLGHSILTPTQSAIDLSKMETLASRADELAGLLLEAIRKDSSIAKIIRKDISKSQNFVNGGKYMEPYVDYRDLGDFALTLSRDFAGTEIAEASRKLLEAVRGAVVAEEHTGIFAGGKILEGATGMSCYIPRDYGYDMSRNNQIDDLQRGGTHGYEKLSFAQNTRWTELLKEISKDDDWEGKLSVKHPALSSLVETVMSMHKSGTYSFLCGMLKSLVSFTAGIIPPALFPFLIPIRGFVPVGAGLVGGILKAHKGAEKLRVSATKKFHYGRSKSLALDGIIDSCIGLGSIAALSIGLGSFGLPLGIALTALGTGRTLVRHGADLFRTWRASLMTVGEKLEEGKAGV